MLTNAIDTKNYANYQKILNDLIKSQSQAEIFAYMGKYFNRMQYIALSKDDMEVIINNIHERSKVRKDVLEKDYYVTLLLKELANKKLYELMEKDIEENKKSEVLL